MGQSSSCFADNTDVDVTKIDSKDRALLHPLSSQDAQINRSRGKLTTESNNNISRATSHDTMETTTLSFNSQQHRNIPSRDTQFAPAAKWNKFSSLKEEEDTADNDQFQKKDNFSNSSVQISSQLRANTSSSKKDRQTKDTRQKKLRFRWKKKDAQSSRSITNGIVTLRVDPLQKTMYYFAKENSTRENNCHKTIGRNSGSYDQDSNQANKNVMEYTGSEETLTKLVTRDVEEVRNSLITKLPTRGKKDSYIEPILVCGTQIYAKRYQVYYDDIKNRYMDKGNAFNLNSDKGSQWSNSPFLSVEDVNPSKANSISNENLNELMKRRQKINTEQTIPKEGRANKFKSKKVLESRADCSPPCNQIERGELLSATVPHGVSRKLFADRAVLKTKVEPVSQMVCINSEHDIYVCDIGLTSSRCDFIMDASERCSKGSYNAYTYAKQTLGCREYDELAVVCEWPVMRAISSIQEHLEQGVSRRRDKESAPCRFHRNKRTLVLDDREPHIVKYDTSRRERQKLDMHTDKSEWTFLIALTDGIGDDYEGGGTYFECIDSTVHLEKGHALIFPGRLRHRGQKIISGKRFLLVGFLVEKQIEWMKSS